MRESAEIFELLHGGDEFLQILQPAGSVGGAVGLPHLRIAGLVEDLFGELGMECFPKTSGSKGMQVYVPLNGSVTYEKTTPFAHAIALLLDAQLDQLHVTLGQAGRGQDERAGTDAGNAHAAFGEATHKRKRLRTLGSGAHALVPVVIDEVTPSVGRPGSSTTFSITGSGLGPPVSARSNTSAARGR